MTASSKKRYSNIFRHFLKTEQSGGIILIVITLASLMLANSSLGEGYIHLLHQHLNLSFSAVDLDLTVEEWINDGLMTIFFLMVGLEIERELYIGELSQLKNALLPVIAALGGMAIPALIHFIFNRGTATQTGVGIPMATDIAFTLGVLSLLGKRVPASLKIFLTALAIIDDLGAIIIIAIFYAKGFSLLHFSVAIAIFLLLLLLNRLKVTRIGIYLLGGALMWYFMFKSGVHATISGVLLAFTIPFRKNAAFNPSYKLQMDLHNIVNWGIIPLFALANTGIHLSAEWQRQLISSNSLGIILGLAAGKPVGIFCFCSAALAAGWAKLPEGINRSVIIGAGAIAGIGFTMSIFITNLAFTGNSVMIDNSKIAVLAGSLVSGILGFFLLYLFTGSPAKKQ